jgi:hypothetical protein
MAPGTPANSATDESRQGGAAWRFWQTHKLKLCAGLLVVAVFLALDLVALGQRTYADPAGSASQNLTDAIRRAIRKEFRLQGNASSLLLGDLTRTLLREMAVAWRVEAYHQTQQPFRSFSVRPPTVFHRQAEYDHQDYDAAETPPFETSTTD